MKLKIAVAAIVVSAVVVFWIVPGIATAVTLAVSTVPFAVFAVNRLGRWHQHNWMSESVHGLLLITELVCGAALAFATFQLLPGDDLGSVHHSLRSMLTSRSVGTDALRWRGWQDYANDVLGLELTPPADRRKLEYVELGAGQKANIPPLVGDEAVMQLPGATSDAPWLVLAYNGRPVRLSPFLRGGELRLNVLGRSMDGDQQHFAILIYRVKAADGQAEKCDGGYLLGVTSHEKGWMLTTIQASGHRILGLGLNPTTQPASNGGEGESTAPVPMRMRVAAQRPYLGWLPASSVAVFNDEAAIAAAFLRMIRDDNQRREKLAIKPPLAEMDDVELRRTEKMIESLLRWHLGSPSPSPDSAGLDYTPLDYSSITARTTWASRLCGSDSWGLIQFSIVWALWAIVVGSGIRLWILLRHVRPEIVKARQCVGVPPPVGTGLTSREGALADTRMNLPGSTLNEQWNARETLFRRTTAQWIERLYSCGGRHRYLIWYIPSIAFVGTVVGIGDALAIAGGVLSSDPIIQKATVMDIANRLGTAFNTTFVGLVISIPAYALVQWIDAFTERLLAEDAG
ncbi:MAG: MotA/TolQ/ExbB proton channel family protein [Phycisphaerae bacterium]|nr:MotA/TolQ/ExbB proton channel family protein [Phycisphaerae bacterium]